MTTQKCYPTDYVHADVGGTPPTHWLAYQNIVGSPDNACTNYNTIGYDIFACSWCRVYGKNFGFNIPDNAILTALRMGLKKGVTPYAGNYPHVELVIEKPGYGSLGYDWGSPQVTACADTTEEYAPYNILSYLPFTAADLNGENFEIYIHPTMGAGNSYGVLRCDSMFLEAEYVVPVRIKPSAIGLNIFLPYVILYQGWKRCRRKKLSSAV